MTGERSAFHCAGARGCLPQLDKKTNVGAACSALHTLLLELVAVNGCLGVARGKRSSGRGANGMHFMLHEWCQRAIFMPC